MRIQIDSALNASLAECDDFKRFSVEISQPVTRLAEVEPALEHVGFFDGADHIWVRSDWLREKSPRADDMDWQAGLTAMINAVRKFGWADNSGEAVRAHIEWREPLKRRDA